MQRISNVQSSGLSISLTMKCLMSTVLHTCSLNLQSHSELQSTVCFPPQRLYLTPGATAPDPCISNMLLCEKMLDLYSLEPVYVNFKGSQTCQN